MLLFMHAIVKFCENLCGQFSFFSESFIPMNLFSCLQAVYVYPSCISIVNQLIFQESSQYHRVHHIFIFLYISTYLLSVIYSGKFSTWCWAWPSRCTHLVAACAVAAINYYITGSSVPTCWCGCFLWLSLPLVCATVLVKLLLFYYSY